MARSIPTRGQDAKKFILTPFFSDTFYFGVIDHYNHHRLHSSLNFLRPVDYYRGNPEALRAERRRKLTSARQL